MLEKGKLYRVTESTSEFVNWDTYNYIGPEVVLMFLDWDVIPYRGGLHNNPTSESDKFFSKTMFENKTLFRFKFKFLSDKRLVVATLKANIEMPEFEQYIMADPGSPSWYLMQNAREAVWKKLIKMFPTGFNLFEEATEKGRA